MQPPVSTRKRLGEPATVTVVVNSSPKGYSTVICAVGLAEAE